MGNLFSPPASKEQPRGKSSAPAPARLNIQRFEPVPQRLEPVPTGKGSGKGMEKGKGHRLGGRHLHERRQQSLQCLKAIGEQSYMPQAQQRSLVTPDYPDVPACGQLSTEQWKLLAEADAAQIRNMATDSMPSPSASGTTVLDQAAFIGNFKEKLAQSSEAQFTLSDSQFEQLANAASQQPSIKSFDDFPYFDFNHPSMDEVNVPVRIANQLQTFQAECARKNTQAGTISFANSRFREVYTDRETLRAKTTEEAWQLVYDFLHLLAGKPGFSLKTFSGRQEFFEKPHADRFFRTLQSQFEYDNIPLTSQEGDSEKRKGWAAGETLVRCWTATNLCTPLNREWCSLLQQGVRMNDPDLALVVAKIWATMNLYCVASRKVSDKFQRKIAWPGEGDPRNPAEEHRILHRGARLHQSTMEWWDEACATHEVFRVPGAIAVSKLASKALHFMWNISRPEDQAMVYYRFNLMPIGPQPCDHAVCLDTISLVPEEQEFLFPPFSSFQAVSKRWFSAPGEEGQEGYWIIDIAVVKNNKDVSADVPLCPWL